MTEEQKPTNEAPAYRRGSISSEKSATQQASDSGGLPDLPKAAKTDIAKEREAVRGTVTYLLMLLLAVVLLLGFYAAMQSEETWINVEDWLQTAVPAITALLGSAMGFYFGSQRQ